MRSLAVVILVSLGVHTAAHGYTAQACVKVQVSYFDSGFALTNGVKEDYWQTQTYYRPPYGAKYKLMRGIFVVSEGYLGDGYDPNVPAGCTPSFNVSIASTHTIYLWSQGKVQSNDLFSQNHQRNTRTISGNFVPPAGQSDVLIVPTGIDGPDTDQVSDLYNAYVAGSFSLYRHAGGEVGNQYLFFRCWCNADCTIAGAPYSNPPAPPDCGCTLDNQGNCGVNGNATNVFNGAWRVSSMVPYSCDYKFLLIHEFGHQMAQNATNGVATGGDCDLEAQHPCESGGHAMWGLEQSKCAANEAFADFYAADVWNSHSQQDCAFKYYKWNGDTQLSWRSIHGPMFDCAADDGPDPGFARDDFTNGQDVDPAHPMEASWIDECENESPWLGMGTEVDWMRVFWGVHTDGAAPPSFTTIARWIRDCGTLGDVSAYQDLDECADARPGDSLEVNWNANVPDTAHNIDQ